MRKTCLATLFLCILLSILWTAGAQAQASAGQLPHLGKLDGVCFSPYVDGQSAETTLSLSDGQLRERLAQIAPYARGIRTFGSDRGLERIPRIASEEFGLDVAAGVWIGADRTANSRQIDNLVQNAPYILLAVIGNETLNLGTAGPDVLLAALVEARAKLDAAGYPHIPVTTNETYDHLLYQPQIVAACDAVMLSYHPYFGEPDPHKAATVWLPEALLQLRELAGDKPFLIGESGWPSYDADGDEGAGRARAIAYIANAVELARKEGVFLFVFQSHDETWKLRVEGRHADTWGILATDGALKYDPALFGGHLADALVDAPAPPISLAAALAGAYAGGPAAPEPTPEPVSAPARADKPGIVITRWPSPSNLSVEGYVVGIDDASKYRLMLWIRVGGTWWPKPTYAAMMQRIEDAGGFNISASSHANDVNADDYVVLLVKSSHKADRNSMTRNQRAAVASVRMSSK